MLVWLVCVGTYHSVKPLPEDLNTSSAEYHVSETEIDFLGDITYIDSDSIRISEQEIFDNVFDLIENAREYMLLDMFLFNPDIGADAESYRALSGELTQRLIEKRRSSPSIKIDLVTDPINTLYGGSPSEQLEALKQAGVNVIITDLKKLRDSNPIYSSVWRTFFQWFGNSSRFGYLPHPFGKDDKVTLRSYLSLLNMKANHRKLVLADANGEMVSIVTSANPHDGSSAHSNVALKVTGDIWKELYRTESAVASISGGALQAPPEDVSEVAHRADASTEIRVVSEEAIKDALYTILDMAGEGDRISIAMFYLAERGTVKRIVKAAENGAAIRLILDPNKDAFGHQKNGIPNRSVAHEIMDDNDSSLQVRWYDTHGEQFHTKMVIAEKSDGSSSLLLGSANLTRRNIENFNLELNLLVTSDNASETIHEAVEYFNAAWSNNTGGTATIDYDAYRDDSLVKSIVYRLQETLGLSSF